MDHRQALGWVYRSPQQRSFLCSSLDELRLLGSLSFIWLPFLVLFRNADSSRKRRARAATGG